jgi:pimeloyl-ACP methyl ester carboxylesterase
MKKIKYLLLTKSMGFYINFLSFTNPKKATALAYQLFSHPRKGRINKTQLPSALREATTETCWYKKHEFQTYTWKGNHNVIMLIHGWESNSSRWKKLLPYLKKTGSTIVAVDAPAHGLSSGQEFNAPLYAEFINVAVNKYKPNSLIGHSIGGAACIYYLYKYPNEAIKKLVLLGAPSDLKILLDNYIRLLSLNTKMKYLLENHFLEKFNFRLQNFSMQIFAKHLVQDGIVAHDVDDKTVAFIEGEKIANAWKKAKFITTQELGHSLHDEKLYTTIFEFLTAS